MAYEDEDYVTPDGRVLLPLAVTRINLARVEHEQSVVRAEIKANVRETAADIRALIHDPDLLAEIAPIAVEAGRPPSQMLFECLERAATEYEESHAEDLSDQPVTTHRVGLNEATFNRLIGGSNG